MSFGPGARLGPYEIHSAIGAGGMGEVYLASDTKLGREVAIKVLPGAFALDGDRVARFQREAKVLASLNHPNIAAIYGLEDGDGVQALVLEFVEGPTLADRIKQGPIPVDEALPIAKQVAEALQAAHEHGIVHRDLKPANIKLRSDGAVKVLDFGLAKAMEPASVAGADVSLSPTMSLNATMAGVILGTAAYMSPEQTLGRFVDKRADIWAFGVVLYEMLTGKRLFRGHDTMEILASVLKEEPQLAGTPRKVQRLLKACLQKDPKQRLHDIADAWQLLEEDAPLGTAPAPRRWLLGGVIACVGTAAISGAAVWALKPAAVTPAPPVQRLTIALPANVSLNRSIAADMLAYSPDGHRVAFMGAGTGGNSQLFLRTMDSLEARPLAGTDGASNPFFSPDGQWIGFFTPPGGTLKKIAVSGGPALTLSRNRGTALGGSWGADGNIVFASLQNPLLKVSAAGGEAQPAATLQPSEGFHGWPQVLPGGKGVLFTILVGNNSDDWQIAVQPLGAAEHKILIRGGTHARYVATGHLVYYRSGTLMAVPFDLERLDLRGTPAPVVEAVMAASGTGSAQFSVSNSGSLAYVSGGAQSSDLALAWVDRHGVAEPLAAPLRPYRGPRLSPDGRRIAVGIGTDIWIYDVPRDTLTRFTFEGNNAQTSALWTPDGKRIVFPSTRNGGVLNLFWKPADGSGGEERLTTSTNLQRAGSFFPDGRAEIYSESAPKTGADLWVLPLDGDRKPYPFLQTAFSEDSPRVSPDGRWVAYASDESGRNEVYVRPFPGPGGKWQVSTDGGSELEWSRKGNELFYRTGPEKAKMMAVDVQTQATFIAGKPRLLFEAPYFANTGVGAMYSVSPDGQRFIMMKAPDQPQASSTQINVVLNWDQELKRLAPTP